MPDDPIARALTRGWVEFASATLSDIAGLYAAKEKVAFETKRDALAGRFGQLERAIAGPWFAGESFGLVDAAFGPVLRYLEAFEVLAGVPLADGLPKVAAWRAALASRPSIAGAVTADYPERLRVFLLARGSLLSRLIADEGISAQ